MKWLHFIFETNFSHSLVTRYLTARKKLKKIEDPFPGIFSPGNYRGTTVKYQYFPGFPGPVRTLYQAKGMVTLFSTTEWWLDFNEVESINFPILFFLTEMKMCTFSKKWYDKS